MKTTKTTIYLSDDLRKAVKKHIIDTGETMSAYAEKALRATIEQDMKDMAKTRKISLKRQKASAEELDRLIKELSEK